MPSKPISLVRRPLRNTFVQMSRSLDGSGLRDSIIGFLACRYTSLDRSRKRTRQVLRQLLEMFAENGLIHVGWTISGRVVQLTFRARNQADHCVFAELVMRDGYQFQPKHSPKWIIDGGANIGLFSLASHARFPDAVIKCYEIDDENIELLKRNLRENGVPAEIITKALWSESGSLFYHHATSYTGYVSSVPSSFPMECVPPEIPDECWLKLDVEGAEYEVLPAVLRQKNRPQVISMEIHDFANRGRQLLDLLKGCGYSWGESFDGTESCVTLNAELLSPEDRGS